MLLPKLHIKGDFVTNGSITSTNPTTGQSIIAQGLVVNEDGGILPGDDFRVETTSHASALLVDSSADQVIANVALHALNGVVLKAPDASLWKIVVDNSGNLSTTAA